MTVFNGSVRHNEDGTTTFINPDGSVLSHGHVIPMNEAARRQDRARKAAAGADRSSNYDSHRFGPVDDSIRCIDCEIAPWNAYDKGCDA